MIAVTQKLECIMICAKNNALPFNILAVEEMQIISKTFLNVPVLVVSQMHGLCNSITWCIFYLKAVLQMLLCSSVSQVLVQLHPVPISLMLNV